jgi:hypothetical protein
MVYSSNYQQDQPREKENLMTEIFTPKADDKLTAAVELPREYALVKSSGYLAPYGVGGFALARATAYSLMHGGRVIVSRQLGTKDWEIVEQTAVAPDDASELFPEVAKDDTEENPGDYAPDYSGHN